MPKGRRPSEDEMEDLMAEFDMIEEHLYKAAEAAENLAGMASDFGGEMDRVVAGQLESYLIPHLRSWVEDEHQPGAIASLKNYLETEFKENWEEEPTEEG